MIKAFDYKIENRATILTSIVLMLQVLRRANTIVYTAILLFSYLYWILSIKNNIKNKINLMGIIFLLEYLMLPIISLITTPLNEYVVAATRYFATLPYVFVCIIYPDIIYRNIKTILKIFCIVVLLSALLMIYQPIFGRIEIFDSVNERIGFERYGSLLGSTTTYGTVSLIAIIILYTLDLFNKFTQKMIEVLIIIGGFLCLSKSFFVNLFISYALVVIYKIKIGKKIDLNKIFYQILLFALFLIIIFIIVEYSFVGDYLHGMIDYSFSNNSTGVESSFIDRLTTLPKKAFDFYDIPLYSFIMYGVGFKGYGGTLGLSNYPMCHNNFFEIILAQGFLYFILIVSFYIKIITNKKNDIYEISKYAWLSKILVIYFLINMTSGLWNNYTAFGAIFFCINFSILSVGENYD